MKKKQKLFSLLEMKILNSEEAKELGAQATTFLLGSDSNDPQDIYL